MDIFWEKQLNKAPCLKELPARWHVWDMDVEAVGHDEHAHRDGGKPARGPELVSPSTARGTCAEVMFPFFSAVEVEPLPDGICVSRSSLEKLGCFLPGQFS